MAETKYISKIATQCRRDHPSCVSSYYVKVARNTADDYTDVCGANSCPQLFTGNEDTSDLDAVVANQFDWPVLAQLVRLNPQSWLDAIALRWEGYGCDSVSLD